MVHVIEFAARSRPPRAAPRRCQATKAGRVCRTRCSHLRAGSLGRHRATPRHAQPAVRRVAIDRGGRHTRSPRALIAHHHPEPPGSGSAQAGGKHGDGGVISMQNGAGEDMAADRLGQRREQEHRLAHPVGQGRAVELDTFACIHRGLPVQRDVVSEAARASAPATIVSQARQLSLGRTCRITLKLEGTYSSTSRSSCPMRLNRLPPHPGQVQTGSCVMVSRGRCAGSGVRVGWRRSHGCAGASAPCWLMVVRACASAASSSRSPISSSSCSISRSCFAITMHLRTTGDIDSEIGRRINDAGHLFYSRSGYST